MNFLRKILFPLAILYGLITSIRNFLFDNGFLKSYSFDLPVIVVGNLSVGGTGKTPQIEYLIRLLSSKYQVATLSRGYKRKSKGFILANQSATAEILGDEPYQFYRKFPNVLVAVDANRVSGIQHLLALPVKPQVILLDDAFQHRKVKAGLSILLTSYGDLYTDDFILPAGNLRESRSGDKRATIILVTKCPPTLSAEEQITIRKKLQLQAEQQLYFTFIEYDDAIYSEDKSIKVCEIKTVDKLLLAGIAKPEPFFAYLQSGKDIVLEYSDHHQFTESEILNIINKAAAKMILTTEKDYVRLKDSVLAQQLYYLPIQSSFISDSYNFDKTITEYVGKSTTNR